MVDLLVEDRINEWVHANCYESLEYFLYTGMKGFDDYTDEEINEAFGELIEDNFDKEKADKIRIEKIRLNK